MLCLRSCYIVTSNGCQLRRPPTASLATCKYSPPEVCVLLIGWWLVQCETLRNKRLCIIPHCWGVVDVIHADHHVLATHHLIAACQDYSRQGWNGCMSSEWMCDAIHHAVAAVCACRKCGNGRDECQDNGCVITYELAS